MSSPPSIRRASRRSRFLACLLVAAIALGLTSCDAAVYNQLLTNYANGGTATTINSGDNGFSIDLGNGRRMVLVNDGWLGPLTSSGHKQPNATFVKGFSIVIIDSDGSIDTLLGPNRTPLFSPPESDRKYWVTSGVVDEGAVMLFVQEILGDFNLIGNTVIPLSLAHLRAATPSVHLAAPIVDIPADDAAWGEGIVRWSDNHWYLYGLPEASPQASPQTWLARVPAGSLRNPSAWKYWTGSAWSSYEDNAAPLRKPDGTPLNRFIRPVVFDGRIVALAHDWPFYTDEFTWATSASPTGPVTMTGRAHRPSLLDETCSPQGDERYLYSLHPHSVGTGEQSLWSFSTNCQGGPIAARFYRPVFFNLNLHNAPCPVLTANEADAFVRATHADFYGRAPSSHELDVLSTDLAVEGRCRAHYLRSMSGNSPYLGGIVDGFYAQLLGRAADASGRDYWIGELRSGARTTTRMARTIIDGAEFWTKSGSTNTGFVTRVYQTVLGRQPSSTDLDYWVGRLVAGDDRDVVGLAIYQSGESRGIRADGLADRFLHRAPTTSERSQWVSTLGSNGGDDIALSRSIASSSTYLSIAQARF